MPYSQTTKDRLLIFLKQEGLSQGKFERACGLSNGYVNNLKRSISTEKLEQIAYAFPHLNLQWLMSGEGDMTKSDNYKSDASDNGYKSRMIPFYDAETTGGCNGLVASSEDDVALLGYIQPGGWFDNRETAAIRHTGESMVEYPNGCVLAVREVTERRLLVPGNNYVIETSEYRITKRVQKGTTNHTIMLYSTNTEKYDDGKPVYEPFEVELEDIRRIYSILGYIVNQAGEYRLIKP